MPRPSNCDVLIDWIVDHLGAEGRRYLAESARLTLESEQRNRGEAERPSQRERVLRRLLGRIAPPGPGERGGARESS